MLTRRAQIRQRYQDGLADIDGLTFSPVAEYGTPNNWLTCVLLDLDLASPPDVCAALAQVNIESGSVLVDDDIDRVIGAFRTAVGQG